MKKIVWVFGESATGKKTLINTLLKNADIELAKCLDFEDRLIKVVEETISSNLSSFDDEDNELNRHQGILKKIADFLKSNDGSVLLIKGQTNDMDDRYGNTLREFAEMYPNIDKEILLLEVSNMDLLYERFVNKDWFQVDRERYSKMFPREWIDKAVERHHNQVCSYAEYRFKIKLIDSTDGFKLLNKI